MPDILLVDDDDDYREVMSADLVDRGFSVSCFADGPTFLEALSNGIEAKVALLDLALPKMSGFELLDVLRERGIKLPVVFLTGSSKVEWEMQALDRGAVDFVDKARGIDVLAHRLRVILDGHRQGATAPVPEIERQGELALYPSTERALWRQRDVGLTNTEYKIVALLVLGKGIHTYRAIYDVMHYPGFVAGTGTLGYTTNVRSMMKRIRRKFLAVDPDFSAIRNVHKIGYRWRDPEY
ncbi:response regulator transcription factor [Reyranella soli]|uniref:DNA-binding response regulator n=1 Tax=Reyranella soli TaxID=1230389 RepID=A0A512NJH2_9HYPH|nr:response regulator transcription factor [Reyranella soli]GEP59062.1 DNA-binding response regulator [Reyranella soli]